VWVRGIVGQTNACQRLVHSPSDLVRGKGQVLRAKCHVSSTVLATSWLSGFWNTMPDPLPDRRQVRRVGRQQIIDPYLPRGWSSNPLK